MKSAVSIVPLKVAVCCSPHVGYLLGFVISWLARDVIIF